jgi:hypothetical protein
LICEMDEKNETTHRHRGLAIYMPLNSDIG